jgi:hypothetical protein
MAGEPFWRRVQARAARVCLLTGKGVMQRANRLFDGKGRDRRYVFVAGMQRSGTNMMMDVLERSYESDVFQESDRRAFDNYKMRDRAVIHSLAEQSPAPVFIIKSLCELQELSSLMGEFAPAKALWMMRHYEDVVNSMLVSFRNQARQVQRIVENRGDDGWWLGRGMSETTYALLEKLVHPNMNDASAAALQWYIRNILFFEQGLNSDPRTMPVGYESLVSNPQEQFKRVFVFLGLQYSPRVVSNVFANSVRRRRPPDIEPQVRAVCEELNERITRAVAVGWDNHD